MSASISTLPVWKKDATPAEWLQEMAAMALVNPERFAKIVVVYEEDTTMGKSQTRWQQKGYTDNTTILGTLECAKLELFEYMKGWRL